LKRIQTKVWSHRSQKSGVRDFVADVRKSEPRPVSTYQELVAAVAEVSFHNPAFNLVYRGQPKDHRSGQHGSSIYPSIYRLLGSHKQQRKEIRRRWEFLDRTEELLRMEYRAQRLLGANRLEQYREVGWSILQHYEVADTP
jgi:hypothetical protein